MEHVRQRRLEVREALHQPGARDGVAADLAELCLGERARLAQHAGVDGDFADVVERAAEPEDVEPLPAQPSMRARPSANAVTRAE